MKERSILFNTPMVQAILAGRKTQTRRLIKPQPAWIGDPNVAFKTDSANSKGIISCPYGQVKDRLWIKETWGCSVTTGERKGVWYQASMEDNDKWNRCLEYNFADWDLIKNKWFQLWEKYQDKKRPSIFMPKWASRITLEITDLKVERIQDISAEDTIAEGLKYCPNATGGGGWVMPGSKYDLAGLCYSMPETAFHCGIDEIYPGILKANPYVWAISLKVQEVKR